jgi:glycosyltransferase involved in cell wall biosynthesis
MIEFRLVQIFLDFLCLIKFAIAFMLARLAGKIIVFTVHDLHDFGKKSLRMKFQLEMARNIVFRFANSIHVHNNFTRRLIVTRYKRESGISVIPHGNYIDYYPNHVSKSEARHHLGLPHNAVVYLFLGLLRPYKGLENLFEAFKKLEYSEARLLVVGRIFGIKNYEPKLRHLSQSDPRIKLVPEFIHDESVQVYLNACDFFVLPYKDITTSGAAALALSFGRPIIAPGITSFPEVVTMESGVLYDASEPNGLFSALQEARTRSWSESIIFDYAHQFDWDKLGPHLSALYEKRPYKKTMR